MALDKYAGKGANRSQVIEQAVRFFLETHARTRRDAHDVEIMNRSADKLNQELADALAYQDAL